MKLRRRIINNLLKHEKLVAVPEDWQKEYVKLAGDKIRHGQLIQKLMKEYNDLLQDYFSGLSKKDLKDSLKSAGLTGKLDQLDKEELIDLCFKEYKMTWKKD